MKVKPILPNKNPVIMLVSDIDVPTIPADDIPPISVTASAKQDDIPPTQVASFKWSHVKAEQLSTLRGDKNLTRAQFVKKTQELGGYCSNSNLQKLERGQSKSVSFEVLRSICLALDTPISTFID